MLANNLDPSAQKKPQKLHADVEANNTFAAVAVEWRERRLAEKSQSYRVRSELILTQDLYPVIGFRPIKEITAVEVLSALRNIEELTIDMAHRARQLAGLIFRYAIATGRAYNRTAFVDERTKMMQVCADYRDDLRDRDSDRASNVTDFRRSNQTRVPSHPHPKNTWLTGVPALPKRVYVSGSAYI